MKTTLFVGLFFLSSCALYQEFFGRTPNTRPISVQTQVPKGETLTLETNAKTFKSTDGDATLIIFQDSIQVVLKTGKMSYRQGHSIEIKLDKSAPIIQRVLPTDNNTVKFANSEKVLELLKNKKIFEVELHLDGAGLKVFTFNF